MRDWNSAMEYEPEFCMATCVAMANFHPLQERKHISACANETVVENTADEASACLISLFRKGCDTEHTLKGNFAISTQYRFLDRLTDLSAMALAMK